MKKALLFFSALIMLCSVSWGTNCEINQKNNLSDNYGCKNNCQTTNKEDNCKNLQDKQENCQKYTPYGHFFQICNSSFASSSILSISGRHSKRISICKLNKQPTEHLLGLGISVGTGYTLGNETDGVHTEFTT